MERIVERKRLNRRSKKVEEIEKEPLIVNIRLETLIYELSQILQIEPSSITALMETGISFKGHYNKHQMIGLLCNPTYDMQLPDSRTINTMDASIYLDITTSDGLHYRGRLATYEGELDKLCFSTFREQNGYEPDVVHTEENGEPITKLIVGGKLNKYGCKFDLQGLLDAKEEENTLPSLYIAKSITNYIERKAQYGGIGSAPKKM